MFGKLFIEALPLIVKRLKDFQIDHTEEVPFLGGQSTTRNVAYIDCRAPEILELDGHKYDLYLYLGFHEIVEKAIEDATGADYDSAHDEAQTAMMRLIKLDGLDPKPFDEWVSKTYPKDLKNFDPSKLPKDLDLRPYICDKQWKVVAAFRKMKR